MNLDELEFIEEDEIVSNEINEIEELSDLEDSFSNDEDDEIEGLETSDNNDENSVEQADENNNAYILAKTLKDEGILTFLEDNDISSVKSADDIAYVIKKQVDKMFYEKIKNEYGESGELLYSLKQDGADVSKLKAIDSDLHNISLIDDSTFESTEENDVAIRRGLIIYDMTLKGIAEDEASEMADYYVSTNKDVTKAKEAKDNIEGYLNKTKNEIIKIERQEIESKKNEGKLFYESIRDSLKATKEILPSLRVDDRMKNKIFDSITKEAGKIGNKQVNKVEKWIAENKIDAQIKLHYLYEITNGFTNFDDIKTTVKSKAVSELDRKLKGGVFNVDTNKNKGEYFNGKKYVSPDEW